MRGFHNSLHQPLEAVCRLGAKTTGMKIADKVGNAIMGVKLFPAVTRFALQRFRRQFRELDADAVEVGRIREPRM